jgi:transposase InsO family protein
MAVDLSHHRDDIGKLAAELEIKPDLLYRWRREAKKAKEGAFPGHGNPKMTKEQKAIADLKKKLREAELERDIFFSSKRTYGSPKVYLKMRKIGYTISKNQVAAIMRKEGLRSVVKKKHVVTTDSKHNYPVAPNLHNQNFMVSGPGQVWVSDITYIRTSQGWVYMTVIIDFNAGSIIGV